MQELVTITVPKKMEEHLTKEFSQDEVNSRLKALASTLDTRGWAIKNVNTETFQTVASATPTSNDRLVNINTLPKEVPFADTPATTVLDPDNPLAQKMDQMIEQSDQEHRAEIIAHMQQISAAERTKPATQPAMPAPIAAPKPQPTVVAPQPAQPAAEAPAKLQPLLDRSGKPINAPSPATPAQAMPSNQPPNSKPVQAMTSTSTTDILSGVNDKGRTSIEVSHGDNDAPDETKEVVVSLH